MKILHVLLTELPLPPLRYGGTERVVWALAKGQQAMGHTVRFMLKANPNALENAFIYDPQQGIAEQFHTQGINDWADIAHFHWPFAGELEIPFVCTEHANCNDDRQFPVNTIFLSQKHAENNHASCYVYNGLDWSEYGSPNYSPDDYFHYLAKAEWSVKNIYGAVKIARRAGISMQVMGGRRVSLKRTKYCFLSSRLTFHGMTGGEHKLNTIRASRGLIFPVRWHEPFGLAVIESLYLGCPVIAAPYGALPEIVNRDDIGCLSDSYTDMVHAVQTVQQFDRKACHEHAREYFNNRRMSENYITCYERVLAGEALNASRPHPRKNLRKLLAVKN